MSQRILLVEDDPDQAAFLNRFVGAWGYEIKLCETGEDAVDSLEEFNPDLILLDIYLPGIPGLEVLKKVREMKQFEQIPVFVMSADDSDEIRIVAMSNGADDFIKKPIQLADLSMKVQQALELLEYKRKIIELNEKLEKEKKRLLRYFSHDLVEKILNEEISADLGGAIMPASILFFDVRKSTTIAETIGPHNYASLISGLFADIMDIVFENNGSVNELLGDGMLATFGCPVPTDDDAYHSVVTALKIRKFIHNYNETSLPDYLKEPIGFGIGIASGRIFAGNIGSVRRMKYAVMGDPVNTAARIQDQTKASGTDILIDDLTLQHVKSRIDARFVDSIQLRGKTEPSRIYALE